MYDVIAHVCCGVLQCVLPVKAAVHERRRSPPNSCSVLQCVAVCLLCVAVCCNLLHVCCSVLQCVLPVKAAVFERRIPPPNIHRPTMVCRIAEKNTFFKTGVAVLDVHLIGRNSQNSEVCSHVMYGVATISRLLKMIGLFCRI